MGPSDGYHDYSLHINRLALRDAVQTDKNYECAVYLGEVPWCVAGRETGSTGTEQVVGQLQEIDTQPKVNKFSMYYE